MKNMMIKEGCDDTSLELRLCPPEDNCYTKSSHKRVLEPALAVVGWPPVRASRKNIMTSSNSGKVKAPADGGGDKKISCFDQENSLYVKINMDGVAIGRKIDLKAYDSYRKLSLAVDELFRGLLAAQGDSSGISNKQKNMTTELLNGNGDYTLVYEDNEGDRILVGDVPWDMFISSVKRLRVLKTSELSAFPERNN